MHYVIHYHGSVKPCEIIEEEYAEHIEEHVEGFVRDNPSIHHISVVVHPLDTKNMLEFGVSTTIEVKPRQ